jgi:hypothetical protein
MGALFDLSGIPSRSLAGPGRHGASALPNRRRDEHVTLQDSVQNQDGGAAVADAGYRDASLPGGLPSDGSGVSGRGGEPAVPAQQPPSPPVAASAVIDPVQFLGSQNRVAPRQRTAVGVALTGIPSGGTVSLDVQGSGGANGTASVPGTGLSGSGSVNVQGGTQTTPGSAGNLRVRATLAGTVIGLSPGFTVAAWPCNFSVARLGDISDASAVGLQVNNAWESDSRTLTDLDQVTRGERVDLERQDNPPFAAGGGVSAGPGTGTSGHRPGTSSPRADSHRYPRAGIVTAGLAVGNYGHIFRQNFLFNDLRTGTTGGLCVNSGFRISHSLTWDAATSHWVHRTTKAGAAVTVEGRATTAGAGSASSDPHVI